MATSVGDNCAFLANSHVGHDCHVGNHCVFSNNATLAGHVSVGDYVIFGGGAAVIQFARVGSHAFVGGLSGLAASGMTAALMCALASGREGTDGRAMALGLAAFAASMRSRKYSMQPMPYSISGLIAIKDASNLKHR